LDRRTVARIFEKYEKTHNFKNLPGAGRDSRMGDYEKEMLIETLGEEHETLKVAAKKISLETGKKMESRTLNNYTDELGLIFKKPKLQLALSSKDIDLRIQYSDNFAGISEERFVWEDESFFPLQWQFTQKVWMFEENQLETIQERSRTGVHVLAAISARDRTELYFLLEKSTWNSETYIQVLEEILLPFWTKHHCIRGHYFIQDNASCHTSTNTPK